MQPSAPTLRNGFDDLVIGALAAPSQTDRMQRISETYAAVEVVEDDQEEIASTTQFVRFSAPYERIEMIDSLPSLKVAKPTRFAKTIRMAKAPSATMSFDKVWFQPDGLVFAASMDDEEDLAPSRQWPAWFWIVISLAVAAAVVAAVLAY